MERDKYCMALLTCGHADPGIEPASLASPALAGRFFTTSASWEAYMWTLFVFCFLFFYKVKLTESGNRMWLPGAEEAKEMDRSWSKGTKLQLQLIKFWGHCHSMVITGNTTYCTLKFAKTVDHGTLLTIFAYVKPSCCHFKYIMILFVNYIPIKLGKKKTETPSLSSYLMNY